MRDILGWVMVSIAQQEGFFKRGSLSRRNHNPGNIKYGPFAESHGAIGRDEQGHAVFPTSLIGWEALQDLLTTKFRGQTLKQIGLHYAEDKRWAEGVARIAGLNTDIIVVEKVI